MSLRLLLLAGLLPLCVLSAPGVSPAEPAAEALYQQFREIYLRPAPSEYELDQALGAVLAAHEQAPAVYKYAFGAAALYERRADYEAAVEWYARALALADGADQRADAEAALRASRNQLAQAAVASWGGAGMEYQFLLKEAALEPAPETVQALPAALPRVELGDDREVLVAALARALPGHRLEVAGDFVVAAREGDPQEHYERGIRDFYRHFRQRYFPAPPPRPVVAVLARFPDQVVAASHALYPAVPLRGYRPFMGFFNPADNLVMATVYGGYGTLLHELMHALMHAAHPTAPIWVVEGMATLFERSAWQAGSLVPLPNWRMDFLDEDRAADLGRLARVSAADGLARGELAQVRLLFLFLDRTARIPELLTLVAQTGGAMTPGQALAELAIDPEPWREFVAAAYAGYAADIARSRGRLVNPAEVRYVQRALNRILGLDLGVDGIWGSRTEAALRRFQEQAGLQVDGVVGPRTRDALRRAFTGEVLAD